MGRAPNCSCHCGDGFYNISKIRHSDGKIVWRKLLQDEGIVYNQEAREITWIPKEDGCCKGGKLIVLYSEAGLPMCLAAGSGRDLWRLQHNSNTPRFGVHTTSIGDFVTAQSSPANSIKKISADKLPQWTVTEWTHVTNIPPTQGFSLPPKVRCGEGTYFIYGFGGMVYGNDSDGSQIWSLPVVEFGSEVFACYDIRNEKALVLAYQYPYDTSAVFHVLDLTAGANGVYVWVDGAVFDAKWHEDRVVFASISVGGQSLLKKYTDIGFGGTNAGPSVEIGTNGQVAHVWVCSDGVVVSVDGGRGSLRIGGRYCEIAKFDFDLNVKWRLRRSIYGSHPSPTLSSGSMTHGITGDDTGHVYVSGGYVSVNGE